MANTKSCSNFNNHEIYPSMTETYHPFVLAEEKDSYATASTSLYDSVLKSSPENSSDSSGTNSLDYSSATDISTVSPTSSSDGDYSVDYMKMVYGSLYRSVFACQGGQSIGGALSCPGNERGSPLSSNLRNKNLLKELSPRMVLSPVSSLAVELNSANLREGYTPPCRKLPIPSPVCGSLDSKLSARSSRRSFLSCSLHESIKASTSGVLEDISPLQTSSPPSRKALSSSSPMLDQENLSPAFKPIPISSSKKRSTASTCRLPFKDIGNVSRSLYFSSPSPAKKLVTESRKPGRREEESPVKEVDASSRDSGFSESAGKQGVDEVDYKLNAAPRRLDLDCSDDTSAMFFPSPSKPGSSLLRLSSSDSDDDSPFKPTRVSPDNLVSQNSNFPTATSKSKLTYGVGLAAFLTDSNSIELEDEDLIMRDLYTLDEDDNSPPVPAMGALISGTVQLVRPKMSSTGSSPESDDATPRILVKREAKPLTTPDNSRMNSKRTRMLASHMDVSPFNPQAKVPLRRALSLVYPSSSSPAASNSKNSPVQKFKRPLPPNEESPFEQSKRHKLSIPGHTPTFPRVKTVRPDNNDDSFLELTDLRPFERTKSTPPLSKGLFERPQMQTDASPELPMSRTHSAISGCEAIPPHPNSLVQRRCSAPVTTALMRPAPFSLGEKSPLARAHSENDVSIMKALERSQHKEEQLTGDFGSTLCLPTINDGRHPDISSITCHTLASLLKGKFDDKVASYKILDCRYSYEFDGGHIEGAESWHTPQFVVDFLDSAQKTPPVDQKDQKRHILIFHCEFSAERGPRAQRLLRQLDRTANKDRYPLLHYPELYLLEGGYKKFFESHSDLCNPKKYTKMRDSQFANDLKVCRAKSKTWAAENKQNKGRTALRMK